MSLGGAGRDWIRDPAVAARAIRGDAAPVLTIEVDTVRRRAAWNTRLTTRTHSRGARTLRRDRACRIY